MHARKAAAALAAGTWLALTGCGDDDASAPRGLDAGAQASAPEGLLDAATDVLPDGLMQVTLRFRAKIGQEDFACGRTFLGQGSHKLEVRPQDFRFFVEDVRLVSQSGREVPVQLDARGTHQTPELALIDFTDGSGSCASGGPAANTLITGRVPIDRYTGLVFVNGVPEALNHADPATVPPPLKLPGVSWDWQRGHRFFLASITAVRLPSELDAGSASTPDAGAPASGGHGRSVAGLGLVHVGSLNCLGGTTIGFTCARPNRNEVRLDRFDPATSSVVADLSVLFADVDLVRGADCHTGGAEQCGKIYPALGIDLATGAALPTQRVYRVE